MDVGTPGTENTTSCGWCVAVSHRGSQVSNLWGLDAHVCAPPGQEEPGQPLTLGSRKLRLRDKKCQKMKNPHGCAGYVGAVRFYP